MRFVLVEFPHDQDTSVLTQFLISRVLRFQKAASFKALAPFAKQCVKREKRQQWEKQQQEKKRKEEKKKKAGVRASEVPQVSPNEESLPTEDDQQREIKDELTLDFCGERRTFVFKNNIPIRVYDLVTEHGGDGEAGEEPPLTEEAEGGGESAEKGQSTGSGNEALKQENMAGEGVEYEQPIDSIVKEELQDEENGGGGGIPQGIQAERDHTTMQVKQEPEDEVPEEPTTPPAVSSDYQPIVTKENPLMGQMGVEEVPVVQEDVEMEAEEVTEREEPAVHQPPPLTEKEVKEEAEEELNAGAESAEKGRPIGCGNEALKQENTAGEGVEYEQPIDSIVKEELEDEGNGGGGGIPQGIQAERHQTTTEVKEEPEEDAPEESTTPPAVSSEEQPVVTKEKPLIGQMEMDEAPVLQEDVEMEAEEVTEREEPGVHQPVSKRMRMGIEDNIVFPAHIDANEVDFPPNQVDLPLLDDEDGLDGGLADFDPPPGVIRSDDIEDQEDGRDLGDYMEREPVDEANRRKSDRLQKPIKFYGGFHEDKESGGEESSEGSGEDSSGCEEEWEEKRHRGRSSFAKYEEGKDGEVVDQPMDDHMNDSERDRQGDAAEAVDEEQDDGEEVNETANGGDSQTLKDSKECPVDGCSMKFSSNEGLAEHMLGPKKPYHYRVCKKPWQKPKELRSHYRVHTGERPFECGICHKLYPESGYLKIHIRLHTGELPFECDLCQRKFSMSSHLKRHQRSHSDSSKISKDSEKECLVDGCSLTLPSINDLKQHMKSHTKPYHCKDCKKPWMRHDNLREHYKIHSGEKPYACTSCKKTFAQSSTLKDHIRCHTGERPFECDLCHQKFLRSSHLRVHRRSHTGEKAYACTTCTYRCASSSDLTKHLRIHLEEEPFTCTINGCDFKTAQQLHLCRHMKTSHK